MRVLVVEDSRSLADVLVEGLRDQGMAVDAAHDGLAAAAKLDLNSYDVVVLDRDLPGIHGDALCQMITDRDDRAMVLMLTAAGAPGDRVTGLALGADDYLGKPFHFPELVLRVRALARRQPSARARTLRAAGIELDPMRRTVTRDGRQLDLSVKEFGVLEALLARLARVPARRGSARAGLGRAGRSVYQHRDGDDRPVAPQARRPARDRDQARRRLPHLRSAGLRAAPPAASKRWRKPGRQPPLSWRRCIPRSPASRGGSSRDRGRRGARNRRGRRGCDRDGRAWRRGRGCRRGGRRHARRRAGRTGWRGAS